LDGFIGRLLDEVCGESRRAHRRVEYSNGSRRFELLVETSPLEWRLTIDKLRAIEYLIAAAETGSFSGAARKHDVSANAVAKLIGVLEQRLAVRLFERSPHGLSLTASGAAYLEACRGALEQLGEADEQVSGATTRPRGTVVLGVQHVIAQEALASALPRFNALYPEIQLDLRHFLRVTDADISGVDVFVVLGWPERLGDLIHRTIGTAGFNVCAAPAYWKVNGIPRHPSELTRHNCLTIRGNVGTLLDLWKFQRGDERVEVAVKGWLIADNIHRDVLLGMAVAGTGVVRVLDWANHAEIASGTLVPVLTDWQATDVPPVNLLYRPNVRRQARVRLLIDFVCDVFREIERKRGQHLVAAAPPRWLKRYYAKASATIDRER
jgi:DNA-binding transcriptional LysR family regulator